MSRPASTSPCRRARRPWPCPCALTWDPPDALAARIGGCLGSVRLLRSGGGAVPDVLHGLRRQAVHDWRGDERGPRDLGAGGDAGVRNRRRRCRRACGRERVRHTACGTRGAKGPSGRSGSRPAPTAGWRGRTRAPSCRLTIRPKASRASHCRTHPPEVFRLEGENIGLISAVVYPGFTFDLVRVRLVGNCAHRVPARCRRSGIRLGRRHRDRQHRSRGRSRVAHVHQRRRHAEHRGRDDRDEAVPARRARRSRSCSRRRPSRARRQRFRSGRRASRRRLAGHGGRHRARRVVLLLLRRRRRRLHQDRARDVGRRKRVHEGRPGPRRRRGLGRRDARAGEHRAAGQRHVAALVHRRRRNEAPHRRSRLERRQSAAHPP